MAKDMTPTWGAEKPSVSAAPAVRSGKTLNVLAPMMLRSNPIAKAAAEFGERFI
jgi:hypothetical protein